MKRRDEDGAPPWDRIRRTPNWDIVHAFGTSTEGWIVLVVRRHITAVADMTADEAAELGPLLKEVSRAVQAVTDCDKSYVVQFGEHPDHPHVHVHVIPRARDLSPEHRGPGVFSLLGVPEDVAVSERRMNEIAQRLDAELRI
ncbi:MAG TPA: HIT domain-containing protein [Ilumatobacteraceae bacterium]|nr:HIT domain-containing protein [Ilumatobacteraceae bacterium]